MALASKFLAFALLTILRMSALLWLILGGKSSFKKDPLVVSESFRNRLFAFTSFLTDSLTNLTKIGLGESTLFFPMR